MKVILPIFLFLAVSMSGCAASKDVGLISELYSHGCDVSSYEANERLGSLRVTCRELPDSSMSHKPIAVR